VRLGGLEGKSIWCRVGELQCQIPANKFLLVATRACGANGCFSWEAVSMAGLAFSKGICTLFSGSSGMIFYFIEEDVGLRVMLSIRENFEE